MTWLVIAKLLCKMRTNLEFLRMILIEGKLCKNIG